MLWSATVGLRLKSNFRGQLIGAKLGRSLFENTFTSLGNCLRPKSAGFGITVLRVLSRLLNGTVEWGLGCTIIVSCDCLGLKKSLGKNYEFFIVRGGTCLLWLSTSDFMSWSIESCCVESARKCLNLLSCCCYTLLSKLKLI
jgi:hypothetical protein